jgi:hypothetical protein
MRTTGENPNDCRVKDGGRCCEIWSSMRLKSKKGGRIGRIGLWADAGISSRGSTNGRSDFDNGDTSLLASSTIFPKVQLIAMSPTVSRD